MLRCATRLKTPDADDQRNRHLFLKSIKPLRIAVPFMGRGADTGTTPQSMRPFVVYIGDAENRDNVVHDQPFRYPRQKSLSTDLTNVSCVKYLDTMPPVNRHNPISEPPRRTPSTRSWSSCGSSPTMRPALSICGAPATRRTASTPTARSASGSASSSGTRRSRAPVVDLHRLRPPRPPDRRHDLPQVVHVAASVVLRHVPDDQHSLRDLRQAARARARRHLQDRVADAQPDSQRADGRRTASRWPARSRPTRPLGRQAASGEIAKSASRRNRP